MSATWKYPSGLATAGYVVDRADYGAVVWAWTETPGSTVQPLYTAALGTTATTSTWAVVTPLTAAMTLVSPVNIVNVYAGGVLNAASTNCLAFAQIYRDGTASVGPQTEAFVSGAPSIVSSSAIGIAKANSTSSVTYAVNINAFAAAIGTVSWDPQAGIRPSR